MTAAIICEHGLKKSHCAACRSIGIGRPGVSCEHGISRSKCKPCECARRKQEYAEDAALRERLLAYRREYNKKRRPEDRKKEYERYRSDPDYRERVLAASRLRNRLCKKKQSNKQTPGRAAAQERARGYRNAFGRFSGYIKVAKKHGVSYSLFYRCKTCQRSTPNVNKYCDTHQDVYIKMQQAVELYQLTKQLKKGIHHVRYQD